MTPRVVAVMVIAALAAGCWSPATDAARPTPSGATSAPAPAVSPAARCTAHLRDVVDERRLTLVRYADASGAEVNTWLQRPSGAGGPSGDTLDDPRFGSVGKAVTPTTRVTVCVFKSDKELPITRPPGSTAVFNAIRVLAADEGGVIDAYGEATKLAHDLESLQTTGDSPTEPAA